MPPDLDVRLIVDTYGTHKHAKVKRWIAAPPRYHLHFSPTYSSRSRSGSTSSPKSYPSRLVLTEFRDKIRHFTDSHNPNARPFMWTATADSILKKIQKLYTTISGTGH